jgi:hypothetical protein
MLHIFQKFYKNSLFDRKFNKKKQYWSQLRMVIPNLVKTNPAVLKMRCGNIRANRNTSLIYMHSRDAYKYRITQIT